MFLPVISPSHSHMLISAGKNHMSGLIFTKVLDSVVTKFRNQSALKEPWLYAESSIMFPSTSSVGVFRHSMFLPLLIPVYSVCM